MNVGNSNIGTAFFQGRERVRSWRFRTERQKTSDEYGILFRDLMEQYGLQPGDIGRICISSVVPDLNRTLCAMLRLFTPVLPYFVDAGTDTGMDIVIDNPKELGPDLIANAVAGYSRFGTSLIVVDFGTALSFTCVEEKSGRASIRGVSIAPGLGIAVDALSSNTAQLPDVELQAPPRAIGTNTIHSIQSGIVFGYKGLVEELVLRLTRELEGPVKVISTGGFDGLIPEIDHLFHAQDPWLAQEGLRIIAEGLKHG